MSKNLENLSTKDLLPPDPRILKESGNNGIFRVLPPPSPDGFSSKVAAEDQESHTFWEQTEVSSSIPYDLFDVPRFCVGRDAAGDWEVGLVAVVELVAPSEINMLAWVMRKDSNQVIKTLAAKTENQGIECTLATRFKLDSEHVGQELRLTVMASWEVNGKLQNLLKTVDSSCAITSDGISYTKRDHEHPVKKANPTDAPMKIGNEMEGNEPIPHDYSLNDNFIVLCYLRRPTEQDDVDYLAHFGRKDGNPGGPPSFGLPGAGTVRGPKDAKFLPEQSSGHCLIKPRGSETGGGVYVAALSENSPITIKKDLSGRPGQSLETKNVNNIKFTRVGDHDARYDLVGAWNAGKDFLTEGGGMVCHYYDYILKLTLVFEVRGHQVAYTMTVTSVDYGPYLLDDLVYKVKPLCIMFGCLAGGTLVPTARGEKRIEEIEIGDAVMGRDGVLHAVLNTWQGIEPGGLLRINACGKVLKLTADHPVFTSEGPLRAMMLKPGSKLVTSNGLVEVDSIEKMPEETTVYNLTTEDSSPFYAGDILVGDMTMQNMPEKILEETTICNLPTEGSRPFDAGDMLVGDMTM